MQALRAQQAALSDELTRVQDGLSGLRAGGCPPNGLVTATVDGRGLVVGLELDPRIYRSTDSAALAAEILTAVREATDRAAHEALALSRRMLASGRLEIGSDPAFDPVRELLGGRR